MDKKDLKFLIYIIDKQMGVLEVDQDVFDDDHKLEIQDLKRIKDKLLMEFAHA